MPGELKGVFLLGLRGSGKSTLGPALAARLKLGIVDTDAVLEQRTGSTAGAILAAEGEVAFRRHEAELLTSLELEKGGLVLALGGGTAEAPGVELRLRRLRERHGWRGVWLVVEPRALSRRLRASDVDRPSIAGRSLEEEIRILSARRAPLFARLSDLRFDNAGDDPEAQAERLTGLLRERST